LDPKKERKKERKIQSALFISSHLISSKLREKLGSTSNHELEVEGIG
jgi:hypothetical protein